MEQKESEKEGHLGKHSTIGVIKIKCISMAADKSYGLPAGHAGCWTLTAQHREQPLRLFKLPELHVTEAACRITQFTLQTAM